MGFIVSTYVGYILALILIVLLVWAIWRQVREYHLQDDPILHTLKEILKPVHPIISDLRIYKGEKSYTINKQKIFLCLHDSNGDYYPLNMLIYVLLHEVAHILNDKDIGHTAAFHTKFDELLDKATSIGIYNPSIPVIQNYCNST